MLEIFTTSTLKKPPVPASGDVTDDSFLARTFGGFYVHHPIWFWVIVAVCILLIIILIVLSIVCICCCVRRRRKDKKKQAEKKPGSKPSKRDDKVEHLEIVVAPRDPEPQVYTAKDKSEKSVKKAGGSEYAYKAKPVGHVIAAPKTEEVSKKKEKEKASESDEKPKPDAQQASSERNEKERAPESENVDAKKPDVEAKAVSAGLVTPRDGFTDTDLQSVQQSVNNEAEEAPLDKTQEKPVKSKHSGSKHSGSKHPHDHSDSDAECSCSDSNRTEMPSQHKKNPPPQESDKKDVASAYFIN